MEGHGNHAIRRGRCFYHPGQAFGERWRDGELAMVFQARDQSVEWKGIGQCGKRTVKRGGMFETGTAGLSRRHGRGALRTLRFRVPGQIVQAGGTDLSGARRASAQKAVSRDKLIKN